MLVHQRVTHVEHFFRKTPEIWLVHLVGGDWIMFYHFPYELGMSSSQLRSCPVVHHFSEGFRVGLKQPTRSTFIIHHQPSISISIHHQPSSTISIHQYPSICPISVTERKHGDIYGLDFPRIFSPCSIEVLAVEYPGYGICPGSCDEAGACGPGRKNLGEMMGESMGCVESWWFTP